MAERVAVRVAEGGRDERVRQLLADDFVAAPAEHGLGLRVPPGDAPVRVHHDVRVERCIEHVAELAIRRLDAVRLPLRRDAQ